MTRICIYVTYDPENTVDGYIGYMLKETRKVTKCMAVVCNYPEITGGIENIRPYADKIYYRENVGFDAGAYKDALCTYIGWDEIYKYDELILMNDSFFGPFVPLESVITEMEDKQDDFWGLIIHAETKNPDTGKIPEHIQSFFIVVQKNMLHSGAFRQYWENLPYFSNFNETVQRHETRFTEYFKELGFSYSALADTTWNDSYTNKMNNYMQYALISYELIKKRNFPFLKRQQIAYNTLNSQTQENLRKAIDYIDNNTDYDVGLIWENIIRTMNISDLQRSLHLQYILSDEKMVCNECHDAVIAVSARYLNACGYVIEYLNLVKTFCAVKIYSTNDGIADFYRDSGFECFRESLDSCMEMKKLGRYKYVCIIHDEDMSSDERPSYINKSLFFNIWENLVKNKYFLTRLIYKFESEHKLGFLAPPLPDFANFFGRFGKGWDGQYDVCSMVIRNKKIRCIVSWEKPPFAITENYWIRGEVISGLDRFLDVEFEIMKYLWIYLSQEKGFYSGIVESDEYASINEVNRQYYLNEICEQVFKHCGTFDNLIEIRKAIFWPALRSFCEQFNKLYIYGTGYMAKEYRNIIPCIRGFIVSDGQPNAGSIENIPVLYLSEVEFDRETGVVVCVDKKLQVQIVPMLEARGFSNYICI